MNLQTNKKHGFENKYREFRGTYNSGNKDSNNSSKSHPKVIPNSLDNISDP